MSSAKTRSMIIAESKYSISYSLLYINVTTDHNQDG